MWDRENNAGGGGKDYFGGPWGNFSERRMDILFNTLIVLIDLQVYMYVKIYYIVHMKYIQFIVCQLYHCKAEKR